MTKVYEPELGQMAFGNPTGECDFDSLPDSAKMEDMLRVLAERATGDRCYAIHPDTHSFESETFAFNPHYWGDCTCGWENKEWEWSEANKHVVDCYQTRFRAGVDGLSILSKKRTKRAKALCKEFGIPWNGGAGSAVHCTCDYEQRWAAFAEEHKGHSDTCPTVLPNFHHKASGLEIRWYKYIGRGMSVNRPVTLEEFRRIYDECVTRCVEEVANADD